MKSIKYFSKQVIDDFYTYHSNNTIFDFKGLTWFIENYNYSNNKFRIIDYCSMNDRLVCAHTFIAESTINTTYLSAKMRQLKQVPMPNPSSTIKSPDVTPEGVVNTNVKEIDNTNYFEHILETCYNINVHTNS